MKRTWIVTAVALTVGLAGCSHASAGPSASGAGTPTGEASTVTPSATSATPTPSMTAGYDAAKVAQAEQIFRKYWEIVNAAQTSGGTASLPVDLVPLLAPPLSVETQQMLAKQKVEKWHAGGLISRVTGAPPQACATTPDPTTGLTCQPGLPPLAQTPASASAQPQITYADVAAWAQYASATLTIPAPTPVIGPDPMKNEWKMLAVGLPVWVWSTEPSTLTQTSTTDGITISFQAVRSATTIDWGDGSSTMCRSMTPRAAGTPAMTPSPDCGHVYQKKNEYTVRATSLWTVFWSALGFNGTLYLPRSASSPLTIGELHAVLTSRK